MPPLADWVNQHTLPDELWVLTDLPQPQSGTADLGFHASRKVRVEVWSPEPHRDWLGIAQAGLDIKGSDFRARHKPTTEAREH